VFSAQQKPKQTKRKTLTFQHKEKVREKERLKNTRDERFITLYCSLARFERKQNPLQLTPPLGVTFQNQMNE
jgi:hypothetical protein